MRSQGSGTLVGYRPHEIRPVHQSRFHRQKETSESAEPPPHPLHVGSVSGQLVASATAERRRTHALARSLPLSLPPSLSLYRLLVGEGGPARLPFISLACELEPLVAFERLPKIGAPNFAVGQVQSRAAHCINRSL